MLFAVVTLMKIVVELTRGRNGERTALIMRATIIHGSHDVRLEEVADPSIVADTDAIVRVVRSCVCGSDLHRYRGTISIDRPKPIGHEFVGVVEEAGSEVKNVKPGDFVIAPFYICCGTCVNCRSGWTVNCLNVGWWGGGSDGNNSENAGQAEIVRVPQADGTLFVVDGGMPAEELLPGLLSLSDVMCTGHHAAVSAGVKQGSTVAVVGDGAVGLCGIIAAKRLGASRIVAMSRHGDRQELAVEFGATDIIAERGEEGIAKLKALFSGIGPDAVLECVGSQESMDQALASARPGGQVGFVGVPAGGSIIAVRTLFDSNVGVRGGVATVRDYIDELLPDVLNETIQPGKVFTEAMPLEQVAEAYAAMDERRTIKAMLIP